MELEHSLYTLSLWESKWKKPFINSDGLIEEYFKSYVKHCMCQTKDVPDSAWNCLTKEHIRQIKEYIEDPACATTINSAPDGKGSGGWRKEVMTSEVIYFYMIQFGITPASEYEHWHLNRLMTLIDVCAVKSSPGRKMSKSSQRQWQKEQNALRRAKLGTRG